MDVGGATTDESSDHQSDRYGSYSPSADVSESESSSFSSSRAFRPSASLAFSPLPSAAGKPRAQAGMPSGGEFLFPECKPDRRDADFSEAELMKERFAKLLLGEDMSGSGKGVSTALAISNAITNLSATVFGELWRLEPLASQKKAMWHREMEWLLSVSDYIVELIPSLQEFPGGGTFEVMVSRPRSDLYVNLPALKKLDAMLLGMLDGFHDTEFWYVDRGICVADEDEDAAGAYPSSSFQRPSLRQEEKWWLPCPKVPRNGLSEGARKRLQQCRDCVNQILKAAMAINSAVLSEMEVPSVYLESLPKSGKSCLGDIIYRFITAEQFSPECLLDCLELSSEHHTLEIANRIETATHLWRLKVRKSHHHQSKGKRSSWSGKVKGLVSDAGRRQVLAERAECLLQSLRLRCPGLPQTVLDMNKIQYNKDVGQSILESYSRVMESLAFNIMARLDDLIYVDDATRKCTSTEAVFNRGLGGHPIQKKISPSPFSIQNTPYASPFATPTFCSSTPATSSPRKSHLSLSKGIVRGQQDEKLAKFVSGDLEMVWSYTGNISTRRDAGGAPERN